MNTQIWSLISLLAASGAGVSAQNAAPPQAPKPDADVIYVDSKPKTAPKTATQPPLRFKTVPDGALPATQRPLLVQPRYTMPVDQHDLSLYPMPVTPGNGLPIRMPLAPPKLPAEKR